jgi:hypothetical protein
MSRPEPPRPGLRRSVTEINLANTEPPPAMRKPPPVELAKPRPQLPSIRDQTLAELAEQTRAAKAEADQAKAEAEALREALAAKQAPTAPEPAPTPPTRAQWQTAGFRVVVSLGAVLTALATILGVRSTTTIEPKVDRQATKQEEQATKTVTVEDRVLALEKHLRAHQAWQRCVDAERDSAIERGTGHKVETEHDDPQWVEQSKPSIVPRPLWKTAPWSIAKDQGCGAEPAPPSAPPRTAIP